MVDFWSKKLLMKPTEKTINFMVAGIGKVLVSNDGLNWWIENRSMPASWSGALGYGFGKFFNTTPGKAFYSEDGREWTSFTLPSSYSANKFTYAGDKMFIYGPHGYLDSTTYTELNVTTDGINWYQEDLPIAAAWKDIASYNNQYIAVGGENSYQIGTGSWSRGAINNGSGWQLVPALNALRSATVTSDTHIPVGAGHYNNQWYIVCRHSSTSTKGAVVYKNNTSTALTVSSFNTLNVENCTFYPQQIAVQFNNGGYVLAPGNYAGTSNKNMVAGYGSQNNGYDEYSFKSGYNMRISYCVGDKRWYRVSTNEATGLVQIDRTALSTFLPTSASSWQSCKMPSNISEFSSYGSSVVGRDVLIGE